MLVLAIGMPRAGSGWHYNLIHDLITANGGVPSSEIRNKNKLNQRILTEVNCNIGIVNFKRMFPLMAYANKQDFVIKAHSEPTSYSDYLMKKNKIKILYIYRDPRAAALSAFNYGKRKRDAGRPNYFSKLNTMNDAIDFIADYVDIWHKWVAREQVLTQRYEDLLTQYMDETNNMIDFLSIDRSLAAVQDAVVRFAPGSKKEVPQGLHYFKGEPERFRDEMTQKELEICSEKFGDEIIQMGYRI